MTMKRSLAGAGGALADLAGAIRELAVAVDDCPAGDGDLAVLEALREHAADAEGDTAEAAASAAAALEAEEAGDPSHAVRLAADAHERFSALSRRIRFGLSGHGNLFEIERLAVRRGAAWRRWADVVLRQLEQIDDALHRTDAAFVACWQEVADRRGATVSVAASQIAITQQRHPSPT